MTKEIFAHNIKALRGRGNFTQEQMATILGTTRASIGAWEEQRSWPSIPLVFKICDFFKVDFKKLVTEKF